MKKVIPPGLKSIAISRETKLRLALSAIIAHCEALVGNGNLNDDEISQTMQLLARVRGVLGGRSRPKEKA